MTLNQVVNRIKLLSLSHKQIRTFEQGLLGDLLDDKTTRYPAVLLQDNGGVISLTGGATQLAYRLFLVDLVNADENTKQNQLDVQSDMVSVAMDLIAQMNFGGFSDWRVSRDNNLSLLAEFDNALFGGCYIDLTISFPFAQNVCQVPTELINYSPIDNDMKLVFDEIYVATGTEGEILYIPVIVGKKILFITRENSPLYRVSNSPASSEYTWDNTNIVLGAVVNPGERFLILFRNY